MATCYYAEHIAQTQTSVPTPYFWFYSRNIAASGVTSRESTGFIDLGASTVKGILGPFADRMRNLSPEKLPHESLYVSLFFFFNFWRT